MSTYLGNPRLGPPAVRPPRRASTGPSRPPSCGTMLGNPQLPDPFDRELDEAPPRSWRPSPNFGRFPTPSGRGSVWRYLPGARPDPVSRANLDEARDDAPGRAWQCSPAGIPSPVNALLEAALRARDPWTTWRTCTEMDPPDLYGRRRGCIPGADDL